MKAKDSANIIDIPLRNASEDMLDTKKYVQGLAQYLSLSSMPTTVAIQGQWGSGKTSFMNQLRSILCEPDKANGSTPQFFGVWINMWEYSMMKTPEQTLIAVIKGMIKECERIMREIKASPVVWNNVKNKATSFLKGAGKVLVTSAAKVAANASGGLVDGDAVGEATASLFSDDGFNETNPQEFRDAFSDAVQKCIDSQKEKPGRRGFIFFIDDLDRINPENAVQILELLKNMFEVSSCIFVLAIDYDVVVKGLKTKFGSTSNNDDRAFRSFFDKIIQMPFSMPIGAYDITTFLEDSLKNIGYFTDDELRKEVKLNLENNDNNLDTVISVVDEMTRLSTGTNPRSIKRLINTLSLIKIISNIQNQQSEGEDPLSINDYLMNYGLVCIQIAYPQIYDRIIEEPNFLSWDDDTARKFRLELLKDDKKALLDSATEFDEDWEKVVYRICMTSSYLLISVLNISNLLNLIRALYPADQFESKINKMLGMTSVTSVTSVAKTEMLSDKRQATIEARKTYWKEFINYAYTNSDIAEIFPKQPKPNEGGWLYFSIKGTGCSIQVVLNLSKNELRVEMHLKNEKQFSQLFRRKSAIESSAGLAFDWHDSGSNVRVENNSFNLSNKEEWPKQFEWIVGKILVIYEAFKSFL